MNIIEKTTRPVDPIWLRNDFRQIGTDFASLAEVESYDERMRKMRDIDDENRTIIEALDLSSNDSILEIGAGTGSFARAAARIVRDVTAIDISPAMLSFAQKTAAEQNLGNIRFELGGFLSHDYPQRRFDAVVTSMALHHLPDVWKLIALKNIFAAVKPRGKFVLLDVVFDWGEKSPEEYFTSIVEGETASRQNLARHIADEFSTFRWIMRGLLRESGFEIESERQIKPFIYSYICVKPEAVRLLNPKPNTTTDAMNREHILSSIAAE